MSDIVTTALMASIAPTLAAVAAVIVSIRNSGKLVEIHTLTNSTLSKALARIDNLEKLILGLTGKEAPKAPP